MVAREAPRGLAGCHSRLLITLSAPRTQTSMSRVGLSGSQPQGLCTACALSLEHVPHPHMAPSPSTCAYSEVTYQ